MRVFTIATITLTAAAALCAVTTNPKTAAAEIVFYDKDGWSLSTSGLAAAHYQLIIGDGDPVGSQSVLVGGKTQNQQSQDENNKLFTSRVRSGFVGTQIGFGIGRKISDTLSAKAFMAVSLAGIDSRGTGGQYDNPKGVDFREAWGSVTGSFGTLSFGRMFSIFGSASGEVISSYAYGFAVGNPCFVDQSTIACGSIGAGPIYAGYNAQLRYATPKIAGFGAQVSIEDPTTLTYYHITPLPRFEGELSYENTFAEGGKVGLKAQSLAQKLARLNGAGDGTESVTAMGAMGVGRFELGGFKLGAGGWVGRGMGTSIPFEQYGNVNPIAHDSTGELRAFQGFFADAMFDYHGTALSAGGGRTMVRETAADVAPNNNLSVLKQNTEYHVVFLQRLDALAFSLEYTHWKSEWYRGETQSLNYFAAGASFVW